MKEQILKLTVCLIILLIGIFGQSSCGTARNSDTSKTGNGVLKFEDATPQFDDVAKDKEYSFYIDIASIDVKLPLS